MKITIDIPDALVKSIVTRIMENFPEASFGCSLRCTSWKYDKMIFDFQDADDRLAYTLEMDDFMRAFGLMFSSEWPKGLTQPILSKSMEDWDEWLCNADATDFDAFAQLACFGEVIYG